jgi:hypothetical protein
MLSYGPKQLRKIKQLDFVQDFALPGFPIPLDQNQLLAGNLDAGDITLDEAAAASVGESRDSC